MHTCTGMQSMCAQQFATLRLVATVMESLTRGRPVGGGTKSDQRPRPPSSLAGCHQSPLQQVLLVVVTHKLPAVVIHKQMNKHVNVVSGMVWL